MVTETSDKKELLRAIEETVSQLLVLFSSLDENKINSVPYRDSWTAAQLLRHVTMSTNGMAKAMSQKSKPAERDPGEKIPQLKNAFLDFENKMKSPDFIVPENGPYQKTASTEEVNKSFDHLKENVQHANVADMVEGLPLGSITKLEILHFVLYHTQRHLHQLKKISKALKENSKG
jgi:hypothetical protein